MTTALHGVSTFTDPDLWARKVPLAELAEIRATPGLVWNAEPADSGSGFTDGGFWVVTRHADITEISRNTAGAFSTEANTAIYWYGPGMPAESIALSRKVLINRDGPRHTDMRRIVSRGFTPRAVEKLRAALTERAQQLVNDAGAGGHGDFVAQIAAELPLQAIADLIGIPEQDRNHVSSLLNNALGLGEVSATEQITASAELMGHAWMMAEDRKKCPAHDLVTDLVNAEIPGDALDSEELALFVLALAIAGSETTRSAIAQGMYAFTQHPDQWQLYQRTRPESTADEILRWVTPVSALQRTALHDVEISGQLVCAGQRVVMFYSAANRDETVFSDPDRFDITRSPNPHLSFGVGAHFCLGSALARLEINVMLEVIADTMPNLVSLAAPKRVASPWLNSVAEWDVRYS